MAGAPRSTSERRHGGTVDHYLGDCVLALFGVPEAIEDAPRAAVNAAIEMRERVERYNDELALEPRLSVHSGIATGLGIAGDISGPLIREYALMGEHVDRADELTHVAERGEIYVDVETHRFTAPVFERARREVAARSRRAGAVLRGASPDARMRGSATSAASPSWWAVRARRAPARARRASTRARGAIVAEAGVGRVS